MEQLLAMLKNERPSGSVLIIILLIGFGAYAWADKEFVKKNEFDILQTTVTEGFESIEIHAASQVIRDVKMRIMLTKAAKGSVTELSNLSDELIAARAYKKCLVEEKPNCKHLKEAE